MLVPRPLGNAVRGGARVLLDRYAPLQVQIVVTRRCNLACGYCNEYDHESDPVALETLARRVDHLAGLGTFVLTLTGGEPFLHPRLDDVCAHAVSRGMIVTTISNGYPINRSWIDRMNEAGLTLLQVSIDNLEPNEMSQKSWSRVCERLELLARHAEFDVNVNAVLGSCTPEETRKVVREVRRMGFFQTIGLMHDDDGQVVSGLVDDDELGEFYDEMVGLSRKSFFHRFGEGWEREMLEAGASRWKCRAGARYLYVDELGEVSYCSQLRGEPGIPLLEYGREDLVREWHAPKGCEDGCTLGCVRRASSLDQWRSQDGAVAGSPEHLAARRRDRSAVGSEAGDPGGTAPGRTSTGGKRVQLDF